MRHFSFVLGLCVCFGFSCFGSTALLVDSSSPAEPIGRGQSFYLTPSIGTFTATKNFRNGVTVIFAGTNSGGYWELDFAAGGNELLTPGVYNNADYFRFPEVNDPTWQPDYSHPGLSVSDAYGQTGTFTVQEVVFGAGDTVSRFHATFRANSNDRLLTGEIFFNVSAPLPPQIRITSATGAQATEGKPFNYQITASMPVTTYYAFGLPPGVSVNSATGLLSGIPNRRGTFQVVAKGRNAVSVASSVVVLTVSPPIVPPGAYTAVRTDSDPGDFIGEGQSSLFTTSDTNFTVTSAAQGRLVDIFYATKDHMHSRSLHFASIDSTPLHVGVYNNADVRIAGDYRACNTSTGSFEIKDIWIDAAGIVNRLQIRFTHHCEGAEPATTGEVWIKAPCAILSGLRATLTENQPFSYQVVANTHPTSFSATGLPSGLVIDSHTGLISGRPHGSGTKLVTVSAAGSGGTASDTLTLDILPAELLANISTRAFSGVGSKSLIAGFIINRFAPKRVLVRALGPSLARNGIQGVNTDPYFYIYDARGNSVAWNYDWQLASWGGFTSAEQKAQITQTGLAPTDRKEAAVIATLEPGSYSVVTSDYSINPPGVGLVEVYDMSEATPTRLVNISTRGWVGTGSNVMIGGFIVGGTPGSGGTMLVLAKGPSLTQAGIAGILADPVVELHDRNGALLAANDNWADTQGDAITATGIPPNFRTEAGILRNLPPGPYTAVVQGKNGATGVALIEVYQIR